MIHTSFRGIFSKEITCFSFVNYDDTQPLKNSDPRFALSSVVRACMHGWVFRHGPTDGNLFGVPAVSPFPVHFSSDECRPLLSRPGKQV
jgi:hypothetical protein